MKKLLIFISLFIIIFIGIVIVAPFLIDLNQFKPMIQEQVSKKIHAKIDFSSIRLSFFPGIGFRMKNLKLINDDEKFKNTKLFSVDSVIFKIEIMPLFSKKIHGSLKVQSPEIYFVKNKDENNIKSLMKENTDNKNAATDQNQSEISKETPTSQEEDASKTAQNKPISDELIKNIEVTSIDLEDSHVTYLDQSEPGNQPIQMKNIQFHVSNIGIQKDVVMHLETLVDVEKKELSVSGPISIDFISNTDVQENQWVSTKFNGSIHFDQLTIKVGNLFDKKSSVPLNFSFDGNAQKDLIQINQFLVHFQNLESNTKATIKDFKALNSDIVFLIKTDNISSLKDVFPAYEKFFQSGTFALKTKIQGSLSNLDTIKSTTNVNANLSKVTDFQIELVENSLTPFHGSLRLKSKELKVSELLKPFVSQNPSHETTSTEKTNSKEIDSKNRDPAKETEKEFELTADQKKMLAGTNFDMNLEVNHLTYEKYELHDFQLDTNFSNFIMDINRLHLNAFQGNLDSKFQTNLNTTPISYHGNMSLAHVESSEIANLLQENPKKIIEGKVNLDVQWSGAGTVKNNALKKLNGKIDYSFLNGKFYMKDSLGLAKEKLKEMAQEFSIPNGAQITDAALTKINLGNKNEYSLDKVKGHLDIVQGHLISKERYLTEEGSFETNLQLGLAALDISGKIHYISSQSIADQIKNSDKNLPLLFNQKGLLELYLLLSGNITSPKVTIEKENLQKNIFNNGKEKLKEKAIEKVTEELQKNDSVNKFLKDKGVDTKKLDLKKLGF